ncbi:unnamed protein product [Clavelina lepadiformis]|uniref:Uncharacterized protein n=1 Tax=Clavelina lepadiformis TaxID=159417 RepID=A0ABP0FXF9_CLALP
MVLIPPRYLIGEKFEVFVTAFIALYVDIVKASQKAVEADVTPFVEASSTIALTVGFSFIYSTSLKRRSEPASSRAMNEADLRTLRSVYIVCVGTTRGQS